MSEQQHDDDNNDGNNNNNISSSDEEQKNDGRGGRRKRKVLVVDDEQDIITAFKLGLEETGLFQVDGFSDPKSALSNLSNVGLRHYNLLLIDIKMPQINGFELYQQIKNKFGDISSNTKVCFITAYEIYYETLKKEFPTLNVGCFIKKPIIIQDLINRLKQELQLE
jgi:two-component system, OmpR family, response regulator ChvI